MTAAFLDLVLGTAVSASVLMWVVWAVQRRSGDAGIVDVAWSYAIGCAGIGAALLLEGDAQRRVLVAVLGGFWSLRLGTHLLVDRVLRSEEEEGRYRMLRETWGESAQTWFLVFFQVQAFFVLAFALPLFAAAQNPAPIGLWDGVGLAVWVVAIGGEMIADRQLARFRRDPASKGKTCRVGLWGCSRHPNYFFEWLHWWAWLAFSVASPVWWLSGFGVVFMLFLLFFVTGIPYTEKRALASRGDDYRRYQKSTSAFIPWFPKKDASR